VYRAPGQDSGGGGLNRPDGQVATATRRATTMTCFIAWAVLSAIQLGWVPMVSRSWAFNLWQYFPTLVQLLLLLDRLELDRARRFPASPFQERCEKPRHRCAGFPRVRRSRAIGLPTALRRRVVGSARDRRLQHRSALCMADGDPHPIGDRVDRWLERPRGGPKQSRRTVLIRSRLAYRSQTKREDSRDGRERCRKRENPKRQCPRRDSNTRHQD
jgi:hypothetical protein